MIILPELKKILCVDRVSLILCVYILLRAIALTRIPVLLGYSERGVRMRKEEGKRG